MTRTRTSTPRSGDGQLRRRQLDEELRAGIELLREGHRARVAALEAELRAEGVARPPGRRNPGELRADVEGVLEKLGDEFDKKDVRRALGYTPTRTSLHRVLEELRRDGLITIARRSMGQKGNRFRKTPPGAGSVSPQD